MLRRIKMVRKFSNSKQIISFCLLLTVLICANYTYQLARAKPFVLVMRNSDSIECHDVDEGDVLASAEDPKFSPPVGSIFFLECSCKGAITSRQACSVESAARAHPDRHIFILFCGPITNYTLHHSILAKLITSPNIHYARIHITEFVKETPLESLNAKNIIVLSPWRVEHVTDMLRFAAIRRWGGIYLDTDMMVVKDLTPLGTNWVARQDSTQVNTAAVALSNDELAKNFADDILRELAVSYDPYKWGWNGPGGLTRVLSRRCSTPIVGKWSATTCGGFQVYIKKIIYPIHYSHSYIYFEPNAVLGNIDLSLAYTHHLWNRITNDIKVEKNSMYEKLAKEFCPIVFHIYGNDFGS